MAGADLSRKFQRRWELAWEMTKREFTERYAGQALGPLWIIGHPLILMLVYIFLFSVIFRARLDVRDVAVPTDFTVYLLSGLIPWLMFAESMNKGVTSILGNASLVKQVVFPVEILAIKGVLATLVTHCVFASLLALYVLLRFHALPATYLLVPVLMLAQTAAMTGVAFLLGAVGTYLRDLKDLVQVFGVVNLYLMPVVYLPEWVPEPLRPLLYLNPFSHMAWCYQDAVFYGRFEHPWSWLVYPLFAATALGIGYRVFRKLKSSFGNVL